MFQKEQLSVWDWILYWLLMIIPFVNIVILIILLVSDTNKTLKNYIVAQFILAAVVFFIAIMFMGALIAALQSYLPA